MSVSSAVRSGRFRAESLMLDEFTAYAPSGTVTDADGMKSPGFAQMDVTYGKLQGGSSQTADTATRTVDVGGIAHYVITGGLHVPVDAAAPIAGAKGVGWEYVLTWPGPDTPDELTGSRWLVVNAPVKSHMTARRLDVVRLS